MSLSGIRTKSIVINTVRSFFTQRGFEEIDVQLSHLSQPIEPTIYPFITKWNRGEITGNPSMDLYLATSPEASLKKTMAAGSNNCFAVSHAFRNLEGHGNLHSPEFTMAEWYQRNADYQDMMRMTQELVLHILPDISKTQWLTLSWIDLWRQYSRVNLADIVTDEAMFNMAQQKGYAINNATWEQLFNQIAYNEIEPHFPLDPFFIIDFPARISPLAEPQADQPQFAQRFELIINHIEIANGNSERFNAAAINTIMTMEKEFRQTNQPIDETFISALAKLQGQHWAGVGLGLDRLAMLSGGFKDIREVQEI